MFVRAASKYVDALSNSLLKLVRLWRIMRKLRMVMGLLVLVQTGSIPLFARTDKVHSPGNAARLNNA